MDGCSFTYHDGERGGVHHRAEDDAEDADDHGALLVGVRGQEHRDHHDDHEHNLHGQDGERPFLHTRIEAHESHAN